METIKKQKWKAGNMVYPIPVAMISCGDLEHTNIVTVGWTGTVCTNPAMTYISLRPSRFSYDMIKETGYFTINLTTRNLAYATDYCGVKSGRDYDKFKEMGLTPMWDEDTKCPMIGESPVSIVCEVTEIKELGSHHMFIAKVLNIYVNEEFMDEKGKFHLNDSDLIAYSHGSYLTLGESLGTFGYSVRKVATKEEEVKKNKVLKEMHQPSKGSARGTQNKGKNKTSGKGKAGEKAGFKVKEGAKKNTSFKAKSGAKSKKKKFK